jgi:hypothetical protein
MKKPLLSGLLVAAAAVPLLGAPTLALAIDSKQADYLAHVAQCVQWFITDPTTHDKYCIPSNVTADQLGGMGGANYGRPPLGSSSVTTSSVTTGS